MTTSTETKGDDPNFEDLRDALEWALAELAGRTRYETFEQRANCLMAAENALKIATTPRPRKITGRSALRVQPEQTTNPQREY